MPKPKERIVNLWGRGVNDYYVDFKKFPPHLTKFELSLDYLLEQLAELKIVKKQVPPRKVD